MRLIGGNISDTPVKEVGDGSAFNVGGGGGGTPALHTLGSWGAAQGPISATGWEDGSSNGSGLHLGGFGASKDYCLMHGGATYVMAHLRDSDDEVYLGTIPISGGTLGTPTAAQDMSGDFDNPTSGSIIVLADPSDSDVIIVCMFSARSTHKCQIAAYTESGGTFSKVSSVITHNMATNAVAALSGHCMQLHPTDGNSGAIICVDNSSTNNLVCIPFNHSTNAKFGNAVASGVTQTVGIQTSMMMGATEILACCGLNRWLEWTLTAGSTPSVVFAEDHSGVNLAADWNTNEPEPKRPNHEGNYLIQLDEPGDFGQCAKLGAVAFPRTFSGVTDGVHELTSTHLGAASYQDYKIFHKPSPLTRPHNDMSRYIKIDEVAGWCRGFIISCGAWASDRYTPTAIYAMNVHIESGGVITSETITTTTNIQPQNVYGGNMHCFYSAPYITVMCEDADSTTSADQYASIEVILAD
mgnify:FL=1